MATRDDWLRVRSEILEEAGDDPLRSRAYSKFYELAKADGMRALRLKRWNSLDEQRQEDIVQDVFVKISRQLLDETTIPNPRGFFIAAVANKAKDWFRKKKEVSLEGLERANRPTPVRRVQTDPAAALAARQMAEAVLLVLTPREYQVVSATVAGEVREEIAAAIGVSRANVDTILSRARKKLREARERFEEDES